jgi:putative lipoic acid-binding regulatory protein
MTDEKSPIEFPCSFPIKIVGKNSIAFMDEITAITRRHFQELQDKDIKSNLSGKANYIAITITVIVKDQDSLDAIYQDLSDHPDTKMVL